MTPSDPFEGASRRNFLKATGIVGTLAAVSGLAAGQETTPEETTPEETTAGEGEATTILLGGEVEHWFGLAPDPIHETENPTLPLAAGEEYEILWINIDGAEHELIIENADGEELVESDSNEAVGATASVTFTASEEMAEYYCEYHPESMRGDVELGEGFETTPGATETTPDDGDDGGEGDGEGDGNGGGDY